MGSGRWRHVVILTAGWATDAHRLTDNTALFSPLIMSDNPSFVLRGINDVFYEDRPIPDSALAP